MNDEVLSSGKIEPEMPIPPSDQVTADKDVAETSRWTSFSRPPKTALKRIAGGRLSGLTDINPQWRLKAMDATFGACGHGWKYEITGLDRFVCDGGEIIQFAKVNVYTRIDGVWGEAIPGTGGSKLAANEKGKLHYSDEAQKMAITDALSVAFKMIGVGSEIYEGRWDGSRYKDDADPAPTEPTLDADIVRRLETCLSLSELQFEWNKLTTEQRKVHATVKEDKKNKILGDMNASRQAMMPDKKMISTNNSTQNKIFDVVQTTTTLDDYDPKV